MKQVLVLMLVAAGLAGPAGPACAERLDIQIGAAPASLDPQRMSGGAGDRVYGDFFEGLVTEDAAGNIVPGQAESWLVSADGLTYRFRLRPGLAWSDGSRLTAEDFVFAFRRLMDPETETDFAYLQYPLRNAEAIRTGRLADAAALGVTAEGERLVVFTLERPTPWFLETLVQPTAYPLPRHVVDRFGAGWAAPGHIVGNGAYRVTETAPDLIVGVRNERYRDAGAVAVDEIAYHVIDDADVALAAYESGTIDIATTVPATRAGELALRRPREARIVPDLGLRYLALNPAAPGLAQAAVRRALSMALDRDALAAMDAQVPAYGMVPPGVPGFGEGAYRPDWVDWPLERRRDQARAALAKAGYGPQNPLKLTLRVADSDAQMRFGRAVAQMWQAIGVETALQASGIAEHHAALESGDYAVGSIQWILDYDDAGDILGLLRAGHPNNYRTSSGPAVEDLLDRAARDGDPGRRAGLLRQAERAAMDDVALIPVFWLSSRNLVSPAVGGFVDNVRDVHRARWLSVRRKRTGDG
jgi:oligopeptide transport system substrate-binding protein